MVLLKYQTEEIFKNDYFDFHETLSQRKLKIQVIRIAGFIQYLHLQVVN